MTYGSHLDLWSRHCPHRMPEKEWLQFSVWGRTPLGCISLQPWRSSPASLLWRTCSSRWWPDTTQRSSTFHFCPHQRPGTKLHWEHIPGRIEDNFCPINCYYIYLLWWSWHNPPWQCHLGALSETSRRHRSPPAVTYQQHRHQNRHRLRHRHQQHRWHQQRHHKEFQGKPTL